MKRLLLVDDDQLVLKMFQDGLQRLSFQVETAGDGLEAMKALRTHKPDLVVLDLMMPKFSGVDVLNFIRREPDLKDLPVIVLSNSFVHELTRGARQAGVQEALLKSNCTPSALAQAISRILNRSRDGESGEGAIQSARHFLGDSLALAGALASEEKQRASACKAFLAKGEETCLALRHLYESLSKASNEVQRLRQLEAFYRKMHFVTASAGLTGCHRIARMSSVLEALLFVLIDKPVFLSSGVLRTIANGLELLQMLFQTKDDPADEPLLNPQILVVDDDPVSNRIEVLALRRAQFHAYGIEDPETALQRLQQAHYDLILLDIEMPHLDGFEFCRRARRLPKYQKTPIIYVTSHTDLDTRAEGFLSGGNDVITKPVFPMELAVKSITHLLKSEMAG